MAIPLIGVAAAIAAPFVHRRFRAARTNVIEVLRAE